MTKDEHFLVEVYRRQKKEGDSVDPFEIGNDLGFKKHLIENILKGLIQANLVKRYGHYEVTLTERGREVVKELI